MALVTTPDLNRCDPADLAGVVGVVRMGRRLVGEGVPDSLLVDRPDVCAASEVLDEHLEDDEAATGENKPGGGNRHHPPADAHDVVAGVRRV